MAYLHQVDCPWAHSSYKVWGFQFPGLPGGDERPYPSAADVSFRETMSTGRWYVSQGKDHRVVRINLDDGRCTNVPQLKLIIFLR
eukprot:s787_g9.t1